MGNLLIRRREMVESAPAPTPIACPYITDGLIFWLDGIERGGVSGQWKDLIGGKIFTLTGCTEETNGVTFAGTTSSYGVYDGYISGDWANETIEIAKNVSRCRNMVILNQPIINGAVGKGLVYASSGNSWTRVDGQSEKGYITDGYLKKLSIAGGNNQTSGVTFVIDTTAKTARASSDTWGGNNSGKTYLGIRYTSGLARPFSGTLYSIRLYNRVLTADEMIANQNVDVSRFGL